jgi:DnaA family protein
MTIPHGDRLGPQLPLALRYPPDQRFATWIGPAGVTGLLQALATGASGEALYVQGPDGSGKTHLLLATCAAAEEAGRRAAYVSMARLRGVARDAFDGLEQADVVAIDDVDAVAGDPADEVALFDLHNRVRDAGRGLVYAARDVPAALAIGLPDLRSRLAQCTVQSLRALDDTGRAAVLRQRAAARGLDFDEAALDWLLRRHRRDIADLGALFERLDRASLAAQRRLTVPFLRQVLGGD